MGFFVTCPKCKHKFNVEPGTGKRRRDFDKLLERWRPKVPASCRININRLEKLMNGKGSKADLLDIMKTATHYPEPVDEAIEEYIHDYVYRTKGTRFLKGMIRNKVNAYERAKYISSAQ